MKVTDITLQRAKKLAQNHYETWGSAVIEGMNNTELTESLECEPTLADWVKGQKMVQSHRDDIRGEREHYED